MAAATDSIHAGRRTTGAGLLVGLYYLGCSALYGYKLDIDRRRYDVMSWSYDGPDIKLYELPLELGAQIGTWTVCIPATLANKYFILPGLDYGLDYGLDLLE